MRAPILFREIIRWISGICLIGACSTTHPSPSTTPATVPQKDSAVVESRNSWSPHIARGSWHYIIRDSSIISINNDTTTAALPIESTMIYSVSIADSENLFVLTSHIDSLVISSRVPPRVTADTSHASTTHTILTMQGYAVRTLPQGMPACTGSRPQPSRLSELIIMLPTRVKTGDRWSDTATTVSCHGKIPLTEVTIREYELLGFSACQQRDAVKVQRVVIETFTGLTAESNNHLSASGSGTGTSVLCLQRDTGMLLESNGQTRLDLNITTTRGTFPFTQNTSTHIERR